MHRFPNAPPLLHPLARALNRSRPWWWRALVRWARVDRWAWWVDPENQVQVPKTARWVDVTVRGRENRVLIAADAILRGAVFDIHGQGNTVVVASGCVLNHVYVRIRGEDNHLELAPGVRFTRGGEVWLEDRSSRILIGENTTIMHAHLAAIEGTTLRIGEACLLAYQVEVRTGDAHSLLDAATGQRLNPSRDVTLGPRVWVGARALILKGAHVPPDSVVAAAAVVTRAFHEPGVVLGGNPARILRRGIRWTRERLPTT